MHSLRLYCDVATCRSFSLAAAKHGITQSAASQRVHQLEKRLGVTLIDRSVRPLALTPAGEAFLRGCRDLVSRYERLETLVSQLKPEPAGEVVVDAIYSAGIDLLNQVKEAFEAQVPRVHVTVAYRRPEEVYKAVREQRCDIGILSYPQRWREVGVVPLRNERMAVVCGPAHPLARRAGVHASELGAFPMVTFEASLPAGRHIRRYLRSHGVTPTITNVFDNVDTLKSAVAVTDQISILPRRTVQREVTAGTLHVLELTPELVRPIGIIYHRRRWTGGRFNPAVQAFVDFVLQSAGPNVDLVAEIESGQGNLVGARP